MKHSSGFCRNDLLFLPLFHLKLNKANKVKSWRLFYPHPPESSASPAVEETTGSTRITSEALGGLTGPTYKKIQ